MVRECWAALKVRIPETCPHCQEHPKEILSLVLVLHLLSSYINRSSFAFFDQILERNNSILEPKISKLGPPQSQLIENSHSEENLWIMLDGKLMSQLCSLNPERQMYLGLHPKERGQLVWGDDFPTFLLENPTWTPVQIWCPQWKKDMELLEQALLRRLWI